METPTGLLLSLRLILKIRIPLKSPQYFFWKRSIEVIGNFDRIAIGSKFSLGLAGSFGHQS